MTPNRTYQPLTAASRRTSSPSFARRRLDDVTGLAAILITTLAAVTLVGVSSIAFPIVLLAALGALVLGEQRLRAAARTERTHAAPAWHARA
jgi:hypothetical protein